MILKTCFCSLPPPWFKFSSPSIGLEIARPREAMKSAFMREKPLNLLKLSAALLLAPSSCQSSRLKFDLL
jgi:hypothetical protein